MKHFILLVLALSLSHCASAPLAGTSAKLLAAKAPVPGTPSVQLRSIDGTPVKHLSEAKLTPGPHRIVLAVHRDVAGSTLSQLGLAGQAAGEGIDDFRARRTQATVELTAKPGVTYEARRILGGFAIVDTATGIVVARSGP